MGLRSRLFPEGRYDSLHSPVRRGPDTRHPRVHASPVEEDAELTRALVQEAMQPVVGRRPVDLPVVSTKTSSDTMS